MKRPFTGRHISLILIGFFGIVVAVNVTMARLAGSTFGGVLADNGYVANRDYRKWADAADAQEQLGWMARAERLGGHLIVEVEAPEDARLAVAMAHPLGREPERLLEMRKISPGVYSALQPMPSGRWKVRMTLDDGEHQARFLGEILP